MASNLVAAQLGDRRLALETLRDTLAKAIDQAEPNVVAQIAAQYRATLVELGGIPSAEVVTKRDELKARRETRTAKAGQSTAKAPAAPKKPSRKLGA